MAVAVALPVVAVQPWQIDLGMHLATVERWRHDLASPGNPLIDVDAPSPYYSPFMLVPTLLAVSTGLSTAGALRVVAAGCVVLLLVGARLLLREMVRRDGRPTEPWAGLAACLFVVLTLCGWGTSTPNWSGFLSLPAVTYSLPFPATFATGLTAVVWSWALQLTRARRPAMVAAATGVGLALIVLSHQLTAVATVVGLTAIALRSLARAHHSGRRVLLALAGWWLLAASLALGLALLWPMYDVLDLLRNGGALDELHRGLYGSWIERYGLGVFCLPALAIRLVRDRWDPMSWVVLGSGVLVVLGWVGGHEVLIRMIAWVLIALHAVLAAEIVEALRSRRPLRRVVLGAGAAAVVVLFSPVVAGMVSAYGSDEVRASAWGRHFEPPFRLFGDYEWAARHMQWGDVILTDNYYATRMAPAYGMYTVEPAYPEPTLPQEETRRRAATDAFFDAGSDRTTQDRVLEQYDVSWVIATPKRWEPEDDSRFEEVARGPHGEVLYRALR